MGGQHTSRELRQKETAAEIGRGACDQPDLQSLNDCRFVFLV